jgi:argininosuccinate lyase
MATAEFDAAAMERRAGEGWITMTELADTLVRDHGLAFDTAHAIAQRIVAAKTADPGARVSEILGRASAELTGTAIRYTEGEMTAILGPRHFVEVRTTPGGPAPAETARAVAASMAALETDRAWVRETQARLHTAGAELARRSAAL